MRLRWRLLSAAIDAVGWSVVRLFALLSGGRQTQRREAADVRKLLLVQLDHFGDAVITLTMLKELRALYPQATLDVLASEANREIFAASAEVDNVHVSRVNRFVRNWTRWAWLPATLWWGWKLRRECYDLAIDIRGEFPVALLMWLAGARRRIGWSSGGGGFLLTDSATLVRNRPEVESRFALLDKLRGHTSINSAAEAVVKHRPWHRSFHPQSAARRRVAEKLIAFAMPFERVANPLVVVHVSAAMPAKRWPVEHWQTLIEQLGSEFDALVALVGDRTDGAIAHQTSAGIAWPRLCDLTGRFSIEELAAFLETAELFVGADSGPAHLAAAVGTPSLVVFSGTNDLDQWRPFGPHVRAVRHSVACSPCHRTECPYRDHACMRDLLPEKVMQEIRRLWYDPTIRGTPCQLDLGRIADVAFIEDPAIESDRSSGGPRSQASERIPA